MATIITNNGLKIAAGSLNGTSRANFPDSINWGTGTTAVSATDTGLETPATEKDSVVGSLETVTTTDDTVVHVGTLTCATVAKAITEVGLFNDSPLCTNMYLRSVFSPINLEVGDSVVFTIKSTISRA